MSNSGKVWDIREAYKQIRANTWSAGDRGLFMGGSAPSASSVIDFIQINTTGNAADFGDLLTVGAGTQASNHTRAIHSRISNTNIDYVTIATKGNAIDFGDMIDSYGADASASNDLRACYVGGYSAPTFSPGWNINRIEFVNIPTLGNMADFGDLTQGRANQAAGSNGTRGIFAGGYNGGTANNIDYITMATTGNATDFGDLDAGFAPLSANSPIRLYCGGGQPSSTSIAYVTFSTLGNSLSWGDLPVKGAQGAGSASYTRGIFQMGEAASPVGGQSNRLESISMISSGDSTDFGDLTVGRQDTYCVASQGHGGVKERFPQRPSVNYMPGSGRGLFAGYHAPSHSNAIDLVTIPTLGNSSDFGNLTVARGRGGAASSLTRLIVFGGETPSSGVSDVIDSVEFVSQGNAADFGNLSVTRYQLGGLSNQTRGVNCGGYHGTPGVFFNTIDYVTIATAGNAQDFGDLSGTRGSCGTTSSSTRGLIMGGRTPSNTNIIEYITIGSTGNVTDFGDLTDVTSTNAGASSATRGLSAGGLNPGDSAGVNIIDYVTIASTGNAQDFGDLTVARYIVAGMSNSLRAVFGGGKAPSDSNVMDYVTIASTGNAADFGDLITASAGRSEGQCSDSHGGLQSA